MCIRDRRVSKASDDFPDPDNPVITTSLLRGISTSMFFRLLTRAPLIEICLFSDIKYSFFMIVGKVSDFIGRRKVFDRVKICYN